MTIHIFHLQTMLRGKLNVRDWCKKSNKYHFCFVNTFRQSRHKIIGNDRHEVRLKSFTSLMQYRLTKTLIYPALPTRVISDYKFNLLEVMNWVYHEQVHYTHTKMCLVKTTLPLFWKEVTHLKHRLILDKVSAKTSFRQFTNRKARSSFRLSYNYRELFNFYQRDSAFQKACG